MSPVFSSSAAGDSNMMLKGQPHAGFLQLQETNYSFIQSCSANTILKYDILLVKAAPESRSRHFVSIVDKTLSLRV